jgi:hypothetical protein
MGLKRILKKITCKIFFCVGSKCSYNEKGQGKLRIDLNENNISDNINEINKTRENEDWPKEI